MTRSRVLFMVGHDDDVVLDPNVPCPVRGRKSRWAGLQSDMAIVDAVSTNFPQFDVEVATTIEELLSTSAQACRMYPHALPHVSAEAIG